MEVFPKTNDNRGMQCEVSAKIKVATQPRNATRPLFRRAGGFLSLAPDNAGSGGSPGSHGGLSAPRLSLTIEADATFSRLYSSAGFRFRGERCSVHRSAGGSASIPGFIHCCGLLCAHLKVRQFAFRLSARQQGARSVSRGKFKRFTMMFPTRRMNRLGFSNFTR